MSVIVCVALFIVKTPPGEKKSDPGSLFFSPGFESTQLARQLHQEHTWMEVQ